mmetsp:Transcript_11762/g.16528  ORF Transcript_11762/g.16528 Transcript_11762/m.16528 type:complete len:109 (+) Transcript_11762:112-438(+)
MSSLNTSENKQALTIPTFSQNSKRDLGFNATPLVLPFKASALKRAADIAESVSESDDDNDSIVYDEEEIKDVSPQNNNNKESLEDFSENDFMSFRKMLVPQRKNAQHD